MAESEVPQPRSEHEIDWKEARRLLRGHIHAHLKDCEPALLDDLVQEATVALLRRVRIDGARSLNGLLRVIGRAIAIGEIRRRRRYRARFTSFDPTDAKIVELPQARADEWDDRQEMLWFLMLEYFRLRKAPCHALAVAFAELGDWKRVAAARDMSHDAVRQQWSRCARVFREELRRNPATYADWLGDHV